MEQENEQSEIYVDENAEVESPSPVKKNVFRDEGTEMEEEGF